ncbi:MAG: hypothetical protein ACM3O5_06765 [Betaproteobacteria bacterium]
MDIGFETFANRARGKREETVKPARLGAVGRRNSRLTRFRVG